MENIYMKNNDLFMKKIEIKNNKGNYDKEFNELPLNDEDSTEFFILGEVAIIYYYLSLGFSKEDIKKIAIEKDFVMREEEIERIINEAMKKVKEHRNDIDLAMKLKNLNKKPKKDLI